MNKDTKMVDSLDMESQKHASKKKLIQKNKKTSILGKNPHGVDFKDLYDANIDEWVVEQIIMESEDGKFLVKWKGFPIKKATWEPRKNLTNCEEIFKEYVALKKILSSIMSNAL